MGVSLMIKTIGNILQGIIDFWNEPLQVVMASLVVIMNFVSQILSLMLNIPTIIMNTDQTLATFRGTQVIMVVVLAVGLGWSIIRSGLLQDKGAKTYEELIFQFISGLTLIVFGYDIVRIILFQLINITNDIKDVFTVDINTALTNEHFIKETNSALADVASFMNSFSMVIISIILLVSVLFFLKNFFVLLTKDTLGFVFVAMLSPFIGGLITFLPQLFENTKSYVINKGISTIVNLLIFYIYMSMLSVGLEVADAIIDSSPLWTLGSSLLYAIYVILISIAADKALPEITQTIFNTTSALMAGDSVRSAELMRKKSAKKSTPSPKAVASGGE